jgi:hypothetical protein
MKARYAKEIGTRCYLRIYWGNDCVSCGGTPTPGYHNAMIHVCDSDKLEDWELGGVIEDYEASKWPVKCDHCEAVVPNEGHNKQVFHRRLYDTQSGLLEPGCLYWNTWFPRDFFWSNQEGPHLMCILPDGDEWNIDGRASNCTMPEEKTHRCWVRHGEVPNIHVDKNGHTCQAGGGSILSGGYHGFLQNGELTE